MRISDGRNVADVCSERVFVQELAASLGAIDEQAASSIPDWIDAERTRRLRERLRRDEAIPMLALLPSDRITVRARNMAVLRDRLPTMGKARFGYDVKAPSTPRLDAKPVPLRNDK